MIPQTILREAVADYYAKITLSPEQSQIETDELMVVVEKDASTKSEIFLLESEKAIQEDDSGIEQEQIITLQFQDPNNENLYKDSSLVNNVTPTLSVEDEETLILVEKLESATSYYQIRSALYRHQAVKDKAWKQLNEAEKSRIDKLLPTQVKALNEARKSNLILDYYELETGIFQIFIEGLDKPVSVSKSLVVSWLKEQERINSITV